jgi:hypothetical protein
MKSTSGKTPPEDLSKVTRYPFEKRTNKAETESFGRPLNDLDGSDFFESLPNFLKAADLREYVALVTQARRDERPFHIMMGAHSIKVGLSPILIDLLERRIVTGFSFNAAGVIHDLEVAFFGGTSEDVQAGLTDGSFGMVEETGDMFAAICVLAGQKKIGLGDAAGQFINGEKAPQRALSLFAAADTANCSATVHIGIGSDIVAQHPGFDGALAGEASYLDFKILCRLCAAIDRGGAVANIGSAVLMPEVFLKALTVARNLNPGQSRLTTANFDMIAQYRPAMNIVTRPTYKAGKGFNFAGHHELMIPLLAWCLRREMRN